MPSPTSRDEYRQSLLHDLYQLVQAIETDDERDMPVHRAQGIFHDTREYFNRQRWQPTPVYGGLLAHIPQKEMLTLRLQHRADEAAVWVTGQVTAIEPHDRPYDSAQFQIIPVGCRNPRRYTYRAAVGCALTVWRGKLAPQQAGRCLPLYDHVAAPPIQAQEAAP